MDSYEPKLKDFNFSEEYFIRKFKMNLGLTPHQYITRLRLNLAKHLLLNTNDTIKTIAELCGFQSDQNMIYYFNKSEKVSPLQYKKNILNRFI